jgi:hypothetical protein
MFMFVFMLGMYDYVFRRHLLDSNNNSFVYTWKTDLVR